MSLIDVKNLTFAYDGGENIFDNVSFSLDTSWRAGLIGRNGRGKTTFLRLLTGSYEYKGSISACVDFEYFPFDVPDPEWLCFEIAETAAPDAEQWRIIRELNLMNTAEELLYRPFNTLSGGEQTRFVLAVLFAKENAFLLIDEPTNHLDADARTAVADYLNKKSGFILVSHDRELLDSCTDHTISINRSDIQVCKGSFSVWYENKRLADEAALRENEKLRRDISRLRAAAAQTSQWADSAERKQYIEKNADSDAKFKGRRPYYGEKSRRMQQQKKNIVRRYSGMIEEKEGLLNNIESAAPLKLHCEDFRIKTLAQLKDISVFYGGRQVFKNISFTINRGDIIRLCGPNGCGKSSIIKLLLGCDISYTGELHIANGLKISYVPQDTSQLNGTVSGLETAGTDVPLFRTILRKLDFPRDAFYKPLEEMSEGQRKKVLIARSLSERANLYIWDEPLNFIDIYTRIQLEEVIKKYSPTMLLVEHDSVFCRSIGAAAITMA